MKTSAPNTFTVVVPAAGAGKRMLSDCPKQYLMIGNECVLTHTINNLLSHPLIHQVVVALSEKDEYFDELALAKNPRVHKVIGGSERVNSVLNGLRSEHVIQNTWVLVHDAARPCVSHKDITALIKQCTQNNCGGLLAIPVVDTIKQSNEITPRNESLNIKLTQVDKTIDRTALWQALTPQMFKTNELIHSIEVALEQSFDITDESSAIEMAKIPSLLVKGSRRNIKITRPDDLTLAAFYLENINCE